MLKRFPNYLQLDSKDCGPTCLKIIVKYYKKNVDIQLLRELCETTRIGSTLLNISEAAEKIGFRSLGVKLSVDSLSHIDLPCILHWNKNHYVVLYKASKDKFYVSDPAHGLIKYSKEEFIKSWIGNNATKDTDEGIALLLEATPSFYNNDGLEINKKVEFGFNFIFKYLIQYKKFITQLAIGLISASILQLLFPFLTQSIVDVGIQNQNLSFIYLILVAQLFFFLGKTALEFIRHWILLHLSIRINISLISDFFIKLMNLPISFFDVKMTGDILQRINDHKRIERILTNSSLDVMFSFVNMIIMGGVLAYYNFNVFMIYFLGSTLYFCWILMFLKKRETLDYKRFSEISQEQSKVIELISGMQEIKLHNAEKQKRWGWEHIQARLFKVSIKGLVLEQVQGIGSNFINEIKNIFIIFFSAKLVIDGEITLGMMMAISLIVGNLNGPILQLISFIREFQDAKISLSRLSEIHNMDDEILEDLESLKELNDNSDLRLNNVSFRYIGSDINVLENLDLLIPSNKVTAIVGSSGSGKTTLMKLLLKFYKPNEGTIEYGTSDLKKINQKIWRNHVGTVMQEGYIFNDTIANNIAIGEEVINKEKLRYAVNIANIESFIEGLPLHYNTKIGMEGIGMSTGQRQRLLIARAVYKNPAILFFDEATSALDANNERVIMSNLNNFFKDKTVVIIAHRLSTVMNADNIVVLDKGKIIEQGTHNELVAVKGAYYELVKNQLQLGN